MVTVDVCWWGDGGGEKRIVGIELAMLPRRGDLLDLEGMDDERLQSAFDADVGECDPRAGHDLEHLVVMHVMHRFLPQEITRQVHLPDKVSTTEVWVNTPGESVCLNCVRQI